MKGRCRPSPAGEAWELLLDAMMAQRARMPLIAAGCGLSPVQCHALRLLTPGDAVPMGRLAAGLACDASNVTGIVDRLEARGLIERRAAARDRRVRVLVLTRAGAALRARLLVLMSEPPHWLVRLPPRDQRALSVLLRRALAAGCAERGTRERVRTRRA